MLSSLDNTKNSPSLSSARSSSSKGTVVAEELGGVGCDDAYGRQVRVGLVVMAKVRLGVGERVIR